MGTKKMRSITREWRCLAPRSDPHSHSQWPRARVQAWWQHRQLLPRRSKPWCSSCCIRIPWPIGSGYTSRPSTTSYSSPKAKTRSVTLYLQTTVIRCRVNSYYSVIFLIFNLKSNQIQKFEPFRVHRKTYRRFWVAKLQRSQIDSPGEDKTLKYGPIVTKPKIKAHFICSQHRPNKGNLDKPKPIFLHSESLSQFNKRALFIQSLNTTSFCDFNN